MLSVHVTLSSLKQQQLGKLPKSANRYFPIYPLLRGQNGLQIGEMISQQPDNVVVTDTFSHMRTFQN